MAGKLIGMRLINLRIMCRHLIFIIRLILLLRIRIKARGIPQGSGDK